MHNRIESFYGFPSGIDWEQGRKTFVQPVTFQSATTPIQNWSYNNANTCTITMNSSGQPQFNQTLLPLTDNSFQLGTSTKRWSQLLCPLIFGIASMRFGTGTTSTATLSFETQGVTRIAVGNGGAVMIPTASSGPPTEQKFSFCVIRNEGTGSFAATWGGTTVTIGTTGTAGGQSATSIFKIGDTITLGGETQTVTAVVSDTVLTTTAWTGSNGVNTNGLMNAGATIGLIPFAVRANGQVGIGGVTAPSAWLHFAAGTANAGQAPQKFTSGTNLTTPEAGAVEYDGSELYETKSTAVRGTIPVIRSNVSSAGTLSLANTYTLYVFSGTTTTWTLPAIAGNTNHMFHIKNRGSGAITLNSNAGGNEIYNTAAGSSLTINAGEHYMLINDGTYWLVC